MRGATVAETARRACILARHAHHLIAPARAGCDADAYRRLGIR